MTSLIKESLLGEVYLQGEVVTIPFSVLYPVEAGIAAGGFLYKLWIYCSRALREPG